MPRPNRAGEPSPAHVHEELARLHKRCAQLEDALARLADGLLLVQGEREALRRQNRELRVRAELARSARFRRAGTDGTRKA